MRVPSIRALSGRLALALWLLVLAGCGSQPSAIVPSRDQIQGKARIVSSVVNAGSRSYIVDEIYTPAQSNLQGIAPGPRGHIWFTGDALVGESSVKSDMIELFLPYGNALSIVEGPDQNLWVALYPGAIGRMASNGHLTTFALPPKLGTPFSVTNGPDSAVWFLAQGSTSHILRISTGGKMKAYRVPTSSRLQSVTSASDGNLWFTDSGTNKIGRMTPSGAIKEFSVPTAGAAPYGICQGPDGKLWFTEENSNKIGSVTLSGSFREYDIPTTSSGPLGIVAGPDGALWFTEETAGKIGRITTAGSVVELKLSADYARPFDITVGSDKNVWFTETQSFGIMGRVDLNEVPGSDPMYSTITLSLGKSHPQLGVAQVFPLSIAVDNLSHHLIKGHYPNTVYLTTSDPTQAALSQSSVHSSASSVKVSYSGHYTNASISANAAGGGTVSPATILPSTPRDKKLPAPGYGMTKGPNETLWICLANGKIARYTKSGQVHAFPATTSFTEEGCSILEGPDGNVWFTDYTNNRIGKITPQGHVTFFSLAYDASPFSMAVGSDGALWFTEYFPSKIGRLTTGGQLTTFNAPSTPLHIVSGSDANLWYNDSSGNINKMTTSGKIRRVRNTYEPSGLWSADRNIWFYSPRSFQLEEMSTLGKILQKYSTPNGCLPFDLTYGPAKSIWFVDSGNYCLAKMTFDGKFIVVPTYTQKNNPGLFTNIVVGPQGNLWFTQTGSPGLGWVDPTTM